MPCLDEPCFKAKFGVTVDLSSPLKSKHTAISNTPIKSISDTRIVFEVTPKMSTYLLCLIVGKFDYVEVPMQRIGGGVEVRGYCPVGYSDSIRHYV